MKCAIDKYLESPHFKELTSAQKQAVKYMDTPLLISAVPGAGKTKTIINKVAYAILEMDIDPTNILMITFTVKAAEEMKWRIEHLIPNAKFMTISTIHALCKYIIEAYPEYLNLGSASTIISDLDQYMLIDQNYEYLGLERYRHLISAQKLSAYYDKLTENDIRGSDLLKKYDSLSNVEHLEYDLARSHEQYLSLLKRDKIVKFDYAGLQHIVYTTLRDNPEFRKIIQDRFKFICVDEYQDTNPIQAKIVKYISEGNMLTVVGDEDQSIYGFRGATLDNFLNFTKDYPKGKIIELNQNFRSSPEIIDTCNVLMSQVDGRTKKVIAVKDSCNPVYYQSCNSKIDEASNIFDLVTTLHDQGVNYGDIAILFRSVKFDGKDFNALLKKHNIPCNTWGDSSLLTQWEVKNSIGLMKYVYDSKSHSPQDNISIWSDVIGLTDTTKKKLWYALKYQSRPECAYINTICESYITNTLKPSPWLKKTITNRKDLNILLKIRGVKEDLKSDPTKNLLDVYKDLLCATEGISNILAKAKYIDDKYYPIFKNIGKFTKMLERYVLLDEYVPNRDNFFQFIKYLENIPASKIDDAASSFDPNAINIMTVHQSKGLEFPVVIMAGCTQRAYTPYTPENTFDIMGSIPNDMLMNYDPDQNSFRKEYEELRRVFYVGCSRAEKLLILSGVDNETTDLSTFISDINSNWKLRKIPKNLNNFQINFKNEWHRSRNEEIVTFSYSDIYKFHQCNRRYIYDKVFDFTLSPENRMILGEVMHECMRKIHLRMKEGRTITRAEIEKLFEVYSTPEIDKLKTEVVDNLFMYYTAISKTATKIIEVEFPFNYLYNNISFSGAIDLIIENEYGELCIVDIKSNLENEEMQITEVENQLKYYALAINNRFPDIKKLIAYSVKEHKPYIFEFDSESDSKTLLNYLEELHDNFKKNKSILKNKHECLNEACPYYKICSVPYSPDDVFT